MLQLGEKVEQVQPASVPFFTWEEFYAITSFLDFSRGKITDLMKEI